MSYAYTYKNVLPRVLLFFIVVYQNLIEGSSIESTTQTPYTMSSTTMPQSGSSIESTTQTPYTMSSTTMPQSDVNITSQLEHGIIIVTWNPENVWNDIINDGYNISWDSGSDVTNDTSYIIRENDYDDANNNITISVCPTLDDDTDNCIGTLQIIVHPVQDLTAKINSGKLFVNWKYANDDGNNTATVFWNDKEYPTSNSSWQTDDVNGASRNVCVSAVIENDSSPWECTIPDEEKPNDEPDLALILGLSIGGGVVLIIIVAIVIIKWRHKLCGNGRSSSDRRHSEHIEIENPQKSEEVLKSEFAKLKDIKHERSSDIAKRHRDKNHYIDVLPYDDTLVKLRRVDYMNASYILDKKFIATPDPMPDQDNDIWQLIYECDVRVIIRISAEGEQKPMAQYIPDQMGDSWVMGADEVQINLVSTQQWDGYAENTLKLKKNGESRDIKHFHLTNWPDSNTQNQQDQAKAKVLRLISSGRSFSNKYGNKPVLIHCGAGSGRTGTVAGIWHLMDQHDKREMVNTYRCVEAMRKDRVWMVQKQEQYFFMYNCIMEYQKQPHIYRSSENEYGQYE